MLILVALIYGREPCEQFVFLDRVDWRYIFLMRYAFHTHSYSGIYY